MLLFIVSFVKPKEGLNWYFCLLHSFPFIFCIQTEISVNLEAAQFLLQKNPCFFVQTCKSNSKDKNIPVGYVHYATI